MPFQLAASRGGWPLRHPSQHFHLHFNSQPHEEADINSKDPAGECELFQLAASRGGWHTLLFDMQGTFHFNSQPHEEADANWYNFETVRRISTRSLTRRLTLRCMFAPALKDISTRSLTRRLTVINQFTCVFFAYFNSQPHEEADSHFSYPIFHDSNFNSQPHEEADCNSLSCFCP